MSTTDSHEQTSSLVDASTFAEVRNLEVGSKLQDYESIWGLQRELHDQVSTGEIGDVILIVEHAEVLTAGRRTEPSDYPTDESRVIEVDRGGRITWHGPGQLVCYPITKLAQPFDVVAYVRQLESISMQVCSAFGIETETIQGRSGVWVPTGSTTEHPRKIGAVGVRIAKGVTLHGFSLNVNCDLSWADNIVPCGITDAGVTSIAQELGREVSTSEVAKTLESILKSSWPSHGTSTQETRV